jgi:hypothetical protein
MSLRRFIASNCELSDVKNENVINLSVKEAVEKGLVDADSPVGDLNITYKKLMNTSNVNDNKGILYFVNDEDDFSELSIFAEPCSAYQSEYTDKKYCATIEWGYSEKRSLQLINYIREQLSKTNEIELWSIWLDRHSEAIINTCDINQLTFADIKVAVGLDYFENPTCLKVTK